jgi:hypothetical protein
MGWRLSTVALAAAAVASAAVVAAHHSISPLYDSSKPIKLEGIVVDFQFVNPHPFLIIEVEDRSRGREQWRLDMDNRGELSGIGMTTATFQKGERVVATGGPARDGSRSVYVRRLDRPQDGFWYEQVGGSPRMRGGRR